MAASQTDFFKAQVSGVFEQKISPAAQKFPTFVAHSKVGRAGEDRVFYSIELDPRWFTLPAKTQLKILHGTVAKMQYFVWSTCKDQKYCGACATIFVPGYLIQLGDTAAFDVNHIMHSSSDAMPLKVNASRLTPIDREKIRIAKRLAVSKAFGDSGCWGDPRFMLYPEIIAMPAIPQVIMVTSDAIPDSKIPIGAIKSVISKDQKPLELCKLLAEETSNHFQKNLPEIPVDDITLAILNTEHHVVVGVLDGHGGSVVANAVKKHFCQILNLEINLQCAKQTFEENTKQFFDEKTKFEPPLTFDLKNCIAIIDPNHFADWNNFQSESPTAPFAFFGPMFLGTLRKTENTISTLIQGIAIHSAQKFFQHFKKYLLIYKQHLIDYHSSIDNFNQSSQVNKACTKDLSYQLIIEPSVSSSAKKNRYQIQETEAVTIKDVPTLEDTPHCCVIL